MDKTSEPVIRDLPFTPGELSRPAPQFSTGSIIAIIGLLLIIAGLLWYILYY